MANEGHLSVLKQGTASWNQWRASHPEIKPDLQDAPLAEVDLSGANLFEADLTGAFLRGAMLGGADFSKADLSRATLFEANLTNAELSWAALFEVDLSEADLSSANLFGANLYQANLRGTNLFGANLEGTDLGRATFIRARLVGANLTGADLTETILADVDLSRAVGLDSCRHFGPAIIDHRTLIRSGGLPLSFLRGCGLPDILIEYLPSMVKEPFEFYSCFISYSNADGDFAERLHADLQDKGVRCWFAPEHMKIGDKIRIRIDESIRAYDKLLLVLSRDSIRSQWVDQEVETALARERAQNRTLLLPITLDDAIMNIDAGWPAYIRNSRHMGDFRRWRDRDAYQNAFNRLLRDLKAGTESQHGKLGSG